ncbi:Lactamase_B domain-containing protein [Meloidogyne graminicola]|uniref:Metallo-beta-lactamase domain-containing protein 1 n=1 Tax=Meloidogyne graminicola TaxID=189291 RepID=A0A8S9ZE73_9BILA|nr:Lactamase_B domain-containing protein [Meloidogyne graminicola]
MNYSNLIDEKQEFLKNSVMSEENKNNLNLSMANIYIIREGLARQSELGYSFIASITLIKDEEKIILLDTGMATDINGNTDLIENLEKLGIAPPAVNIVITTHGHVIFTTFISPTTLNNRKADHSGNNNLFPDAIHYQGLIVHYRTKFNFTGLFEKNFISLTKNVLLIKTPGHTSEDISVIVKNTEQYGTIIIAGDIFISVDDINSPIMWKPLAFDEIEQEKNRQLIICCADYIIPGHGKMLLFLNLHIFITSNF